MTDIPIRTDSAPGDGRPAIDLGLREASGTSAGSAALAEAQANMAEAAAKAGIGELQTNVAPPPPEAPSGPSLRDSLVMPAVAPTEPAASPAVAPAPEITPPAPPPNVLGENQKLVVPEPFPMPHAYSDPKPEGGFTPPSIEERPGGAPVLTEAERYEADTADLAEIERVRKEADETTRRIVARMFDRHAA